MYLKADMQYRRPRLSAQRSSASEKVPEGLLTVARQFHWREKAGSRNCVPDGALETSARMRNVFSCVADGNRLASRRPPSVQERSQQKPKGGGDD